MDKPLCIDIYCGLGGWSDGFIAEGWDCVGFDIEKHDYGTGGYPGQLVLQDALTIHGSQFRMAQCIVASPPCQEYSYMAMPWSRAKAIAAEYRSGVRDVKNLTALFDACFRIQREAIEAAGRFVPLVVENVRGAQAWVGRSRWNFGSFHLWGDVPALMPMTSKRVMKQGIAHRPDGVTNFHGHREISAAWRDKHYDETEKADHHKNNGGSWFNIGSPGQKETNRNPVHELTGLKAPGNDGPRLWSEREVQRLCDATKNGGDWFGSGDNCSLQRRASSKSDSRKAASAMIAKIPLALSRHIAKVYSQ